MDELNYSFDYPMVVTRVFDEHDGWMWRAEYPDVSGAMIQDTDKNAAISEAEEALAACIDTRKQLGLKIPFPKSKSVVA